MKADSEAPLDVAYQQEMSRDIEELKGDSPWSFWMGPAFLLCTLALVSWLSPQEIGIWLLATLAGMALCVRYQMKGCIYAILLLAAFSAARHSSILGGHVVYFGIEGSLACSFLIMALAIEQRFSKLKCLNEQATAQSLTIGNLEQNIAKLIESSQAEQIALAERAATKEKELEDIQSELSSVLVLNEVLRKTTAAQLKESRERAEALIDRERKIAFLTSERDQLESQLETFRSESSVIQEHEKVSQELNQARCEYAQLQLMHEHLENAYQQKTNSLEMAESEGREGLLQVKTMQEKLASLEADHQTLKADREALLEKLHGTYASEEAMRHWQEEKENLETKLKAAGEKVFAKDAIIQEFEERLIQAEKTFGEKKRSLEESIHSLQNQIDESVSECLSLSTLTEALREASASQLVELQDKEAQNEALASNNKSLADELDKLRSESLIIQENIKLSDEIRTKEYELDQLRKELHNVSYLYDKQSDHAEEIHQKLCAFSAEKQAIQQEIGALRAENHLLKSQVEQLTKDKSASLGSIQKLQELNNEKNLLQERLKAAELELATLSKRQAPNPMPVKENPALQAEREALFDKLADAESRLAIMEERVKKSAQLEALHNQLKAQFEEKNVVLHDTRAQLFRTDTELQKLKLEKQQKELEPPFFSNEIQTSISQLEAELVDLQTENQELQAMISQLLKEKADS